MKQFKVITPKGFKIGETLHKQGDTFSAPSKSAHVQTGLHFKQIAPAEDVSASDESAPADPPKAPEASRKVRPSLI